jgi:hypothetical protein
MRDNELKHKYQCPFCVKKIVNIRLHYEKYHRNIPYNIFYYSLNPQKLVQKIDNK